MTKNWNFKQWFACNIPWQQYYVSLKRNRNVIDAILILLRYEFLSVWLLLMASLYYLGHLKQPCWSRATLITWRCQLWRLGPVSKSLDNFAKSREILKQRGDDRRFQWNLALHRAEHAKQSDTEILAYNHEVTRLRKLLLCTTIAVL